MRLRALAGLLVAGLFLAIASTARANGNESWRFTIAPYLWLPSVETEVAVDGVPLEFETDTDSDDLFDQLDFALLVCGEIRKGKVGLFYDVQALKLSGDGTTEGIAPRGYETDITFADSTLGLQYRVIQEPKSALDLFIGARVMYAEVSADVGPGVILPGFSVEEDKTWVDPIIGAKARFRFNEHWGLFGYGDVGGFGVSSELTYQVMGTVVYEFNKTIALHAGYRVFGVDFEDGGFKFDATVHGPLVGLQFSF